MLHCDYSYNCKVWLFFVFKGISDKLGFSFVFSAVFHSSEPHKAEMLLPLHVLLFTLWHILKSSVCEVVE